MGTGILFSHSLFPPTPRSHAGRSSRADAAQKWRGTCNDKINDVDVCQWLSCDDVMR